MNEVFEKFSFTHWLLVDSNVMDLALKQWSRCYDQGYELLQHWLQHLILF
jgi:hypothetical protein